METRSVTLRILGDDRSARSAFDWVNAEADKVDSRKPTMKIGADASGAMGKMAGLRAAVAELTDRMHEVKFSADDAGFNATLAAMLAKLQAFRSLADRPILSEKMLAQSKADVLKLAAGFDKLVASQQAAATAARQNAIDQAQADAIMRNEALDAMQLEAIQRNAAYDRAIFAQVDRHRNPRTDEALAMMPGFPIIGKPPGSGGGMFGMAAGIPLFGGIFAVSGMHLLIDGAIELAAKIIPATVALVAFSGALTALAPNAEMIYQRELNIHTATDVLGQQFPLLTSKLTQFGNRVPVTATSLNALNQQFRPGVIQIWGDALTVASSGAGTLQKLLSMAVPWLDRFAAKMTVDLTSGSNKFLKFVEQGAHDLGQFGQVLAPLANGFMNLIRIANKTGIANDLMSVLIVGARLLDLLTKLPTPVLVLAAALHGTYVWGGLAVTGISRLVGVIGSIPGLGGLKVLQDIPGLLDSMATKGLEAGRGLEYVAVKGMRATYVDSQGAVKEMGLFKTGLAALTAVPVWGWVAAGAVALMGLGYWLTRSKDATKEWIDGLDKAVAKAGNANAFNVMAGDFGQLNQKMSQATSMAAQTLKAFGPVSWNSTFTSATKSQQELGREIQKFTGQMTNMATGAGWIMKTFGVSYPVAIAIASRAGVNLTQSLMGNSKQAQILRQQIFGLVEGFNQLQGPSGIAGKDFQALAFASNDITQKINQLNSAWHQWLGVVTGGQTTFDSFAQGMKDLSTQGGNFTWRLGQLSVTGKQGKAAIDSLSASGINLNQAFMQQVMNADNVIAALRSQNASQGTLVASTKLMVAQLLPFAAGSKEATSVLFGLAQEADYTGNNSFKNLADWAGIKTKNALGLLKGQMDASTTAASNLANTVQNLLTTDFQHFVYVNSGAQAALNKYTTDLINNTNTTRQGRADRQTLITDLMKTGMNAKQAQTLVDNLTSSLRNIPPTLSASIHMNGQGQYTIVGPAILASQGKGGSGNLAGGLAAGGLITRGTTPTADDVFIRVSRGEAVVPAHIVPSVAPILSAHHVPGFAAGGVVSSGSYSGAVYPGLANFATGMYRTFQQDMLSSMVNAMRGGLNSLAQMFVGSGGGAGVTRWAAVIVEALRLLGQPTSLLGAVEHRMSIESGGQPAIVNRWDSNWLAGHPSVGLMQVIAGTFARYAGPFRNVGPFEYGVSINPLANIYAGLNYALNAYGSIYSAMMKSGGYAGGGIISEPMFAIGRSGQGLWLGERGPELVTPLNRAAARGGGDIYIQVTVEAGDCVDPNAVAMAIHEKLRRLKQLRGGVSLNL